MATVPSTPTLSFDPAFGSHMVLQRLRPLVITGAAPALAEVAVRLGSRTDTVRADAQGRFSCTLTALRAGGPYTLSAACGALRTELIDILVGDVWLCSGQSNMEWRLGAMPSRYAQEIHSATDTRIRLVTVPNRRALEPVPALTGATWQCLSPQSVRDFSAVGYFFGRDLATSQDVPIGLMCAAWGGTYIETWIDPRSLATLPEFAGRAHPLPEVRERAVEYRAHMHSWMAFLNQHDPGLKARYQDPAFDDRAWPTVRLPHPHADSDLKDITGTVWYRYHLTLPATWAGRAINLYLAAIDTFDELYINGQLVRATTPATSHPELQFRCYTAIPASHFHADRENVIAVRVFDTGNGPGGICQRWPWCTVQIEPQDHSADEVLFINAGWRYHVGFVSAATEDWRGRLGLPARRDEAARAADAPAAAGAHDAAFFVEPPDPESPNFPSLLYHGMIHPLAGLALAGVIWYQGESNTDRPERYRQLQPLLFASWRALWRQADLPFVIVQLANYRSGEADLVQPVDSAWARLRESQDVARLDARAGVAVTIEIGDAEDIHPLNKLDVGLRLARQARVVVYGEPDLVAGGPWLRSWQSEPGDQVRLHFHDAAGLATRDGLPIRQLAVAGPDRRFVWAVGRIDGESLVVAHPQGGPVTAVRYAWANNPAGVNLVNGAGLPMGPFRTDDWPSAT